MRQTMLYNIDSSPDAGVEKRAEKADRIPLRVGPMESPRAKAINRTASNSSEIQMSRVI
jgi:hypothetical protein